MNVRPSFPVTAALAAVVLLVCANDLFAQTRPGTVGLGAQLGDPSGITLKLYQRNDFAYDFLAAWDLDDFFFLNGHALYERPIPDSPLHYYFGPGIVIGIEDRGRDRDTELIIGISGQVGLNFFVERFEVFLQLTPRLNIIPDTRGDLGGGIGLRYYFP